MPETDQVVQLSAPQHAAKSEPEIHNTPKAIDKIRQGHNLGAYSGAVTQPALITEMLKQRRYSLFSEGHRWVDVRRYDLLGTLPIDRPDDDVWTEFPLPALERF